MEISIEEAPMRSRCTLVFLLLLGVIFTTASCQKPYHDEKERYVLVAVTVKLPYWQEAEAGLRDVSQQLGVKAELVGPENFDPQEELRAFQKAVSENPAGILISVSRPDLFQEAINSAVASGIPVITLDADAPDAKRVLFIGTDNFRAGQESGKRMADLLGGQGRIIVVGLGGQLNTEQRSRGVEEALKKYPGVKVVQTIDGKGDPRVTFDAISSLLQKKEKFDGIIALEATGAEA